MSPRTFLIVCIQILQTLKIPEWFLFGNQVLLNVCWQQLHSYCAISVDQNLSSKQFCYIRTIFECRSTSLLTVIYYFCGQIYKYGMTELTNSTCIFLLCVQKYHHFEYVVFHGLYQKTGIAVVLKRSSDSGSYYKKCMRKLVEANEVILNNNAKNFIPLCIVCA